MTENAGKFWLAAVFCICMMGAVSFGQSDPVKLEKKTHHPCDAHYYIYNWSGLSHHGLEGSSESKCLDVAIRNANSSDAANLQILRILTHLALLQGYLK